MAMAWVVPILRRCGACGFKFSESAAACPECGATRAVAKGRRGPADLRGLPPLESDEDFRREAGRLAPLVHRRIAGAAAVRAFYAAMREIRSRAGWRKFSERERAAFVDRLVAKALEDAGERA